MSGFAWPSFNLLTQSILSGIFVGALYGLMGLGLGLSWGLLRLINLAHFAFAFLAAYLCYQLAHKGIDPLLSLALIVPLFFAIGAALHWVMARFALTPFSSLLLTFGLTGIIESLIQSIWTADFRKLESSYGDARWQVGSLYFPAPELLTLFLALSLVLAGTCAALASVAGVCVALLFSLAPSQIYAWIGVVFAAVMLGGLGSAWGPLVAGLLLGISESVTMALTSPSWAPLVSFTLLILVLLLRPGKAGT